MFQDRYSLNKFIEESKNLASMIEKYRENEETLIEARSEHEQLLKMEILSSEVKIVTDVQSFIEQQREIIERDEKISELESRIHECLSRKSNWSNWFLKFFPSGVWFKVDEWGIGMRLHSHGEPGTLYIEPWTDEMTDLQFTTDDKQVLATAD